MKLKKIALVIFLLFLVVVISGCSISIGSNSTNRDGGIWKSADGGKTWAQKVALSSVKGGVNISKVGITNMVFDPQDSNTIYLSTESDGIVYTYDGGESWRQFTYFAKTRVRAVAVDYESKCELYAVALNKVFKSVDCGRTWQNTYYHQNAEVFITDIVTDHHNSGIVYVSTSDGEVLRSQNNGETWVAVYRNDRATFIDLVVDPHNSLVVYVASLSKGIFKTTDAGASWVSLGEGLESYSGSHKYRSLIVDNATPGGLILISQYGMLRSFDYGKTWSIVELLPEQKNTVVYAVDVDPKNSDIIYYATRTTLLKSVDGGKSWSSRKLPFSKAVRKIIVHPVETSTLFMGTYVPTN